MDPEKVAAVSKMKSPQTIKELRAILGLVGFYRRFIQDFRKIAEPLYKLLNKKERFTWSKECESAVEQLKQALQKAPILGYPNDTDPYTLTTDASLFGIGAIISRRPQWGERVIRKQNAQQKSTKLFCDKTRIFCNSLLYSTLQKLSFGTKIFNCY